MRRLLCLGVLAAVDALGSDKLFLGASGVRQLDRSGVRAVAANETDAAGWVVAFYAPWCGHCQHYAHRSASSAPRSRRAATLCARAP